MCNINEIFINLKKKISVIKNIIQFYKNLGFLSNIVEKIVH